MRHQAVETVEQRALRCINDLFLLLVYSRQSYYQGKKHIQQQAYEADIIITESLKYRTYQKYLSTRKLLAKMQIYSDSHRFKIGRDALFSLLSDRYLLVLKCKRKGSIPTFSKHRYRHLNKLYENPLPDWKNKLTQVILSDIFMPAISSRIFAYTNIAAYEALRPACKNYPSYAGKLNGL